MLEVMNGRHFVKVHRFVLCSWELGYPQLWHAATLEECLEHMEALKPCVVVDRETQKFVARCVD